MANKRYYLVEQGYKEESMAVKPIMMPNINDAISEGRRVLKSNYLLKSVTIVNPKEVFNVVIERD